MVDKIAAALAERGVGAGDVVGLFAPNSPEWAAVFHGVLRANAIVTSANSLYTPGELAHQLADSGAKLLVTVSPFLDRARAALAEAGLPDDAVVTLDAVEGVTLARRPARHDRRRPPSSPPRRRHRGAAVLVGHHRAGQGRRSSRTATSSRTCCQFAADGPRRVRHEDPRRPAVLPHLRHDRDDEPGPAQARHGRDDAEVRPHRVPADHLRVPRSTGSTSPRRWPSRWPSTRWSTSTTSPASTSIFSGAAPLDAELGHAMGKRLSCTVLQGYGMTELSPVSHCMPDDRPDMDLNSSGFALPNVDVQAGRPGDRRGGRPRRPRRAVGARART